MSVVLSVEDTGTCRKEVTIEVPASAVEAETRNLVKLYKSQVNLPGFRKGKAPASIVRKRFRQEIDREVVEKLIPRFWEKAQEEEGLQPLGQPQLKEIDELADDGPLRFVTVVEVRPEVDLGEVAPEQFELPEVEVEPSDEDVDAALDDLRRQIGDWNEVDRAAARGDQVTLRIVEEGAEDEAAAADAGDDAGDDEGADEGADEEAADAEDADSEAADSESGDEVQIEVGDANVWEELSLAVTGLEAGQEGRFTRRPPAPAEGEEAPEPRTFKVKVKQVQERELPDLDDELAKRLGDFDSVDELREAMASKLRHDRGHERDAKRREALMEQMRHRYPLPLPEGVLHEEAQVMLNDYARDMASKGIDPQNAGIDWEQLGEQFKPHAMRRLHDRLLLDAVADERGVEVSDSEVDGAIASVAQAQGASFQQMSEALGDRRPGLARQIRREKAMKWLLDEEADAADAAEAVATDEVATDEAAPDDAASTEPATESTAAEAPDSAEGADADDTAAADTDTDTDTDTDDSDTKS